MLLVFLQELAIRGGPNYDLDGLYSKLQRHYKNAKRRGLWRNTYAMDTVREYFAEGAQSFFNCHISVDPPNGIHNNINTRDKLLRYDPGLYGLLEEVFPCKNTYHWCYKGQFNNNSLLTYKLITIELATVTNLFPSFQDLRLIPSSLAGFNIFLFNNSFLVVVTVNPRI